jgi:hypothetical protein
VIGVDNRINARTTGRVVVHGADSSIPKMVN